jgi:hypothetical protein
MAQVQQRVLRTAAAALMMLAAASEAHARKFYDDDPLGHTPPPMNVAQAKNRKLNDIYDFMFMTFGKPGEKQLPGKLIPAGAVNTLGDVPDSEWYTNRHWKKRMTIDELVRGPGNQSPPATDRPWQVTAAKTEGVTPGFTIKDSKGRSYQIKFDTPANFEQATGADVMGTKFFYALGYNTPENYIVYFTPEQLRVGEKTMIVDYRGVERPMRQGDIASVLAKLPKDRSGRFRAVASLFLNGKPAGPFRYNGTRTDDPNDIVPHEHRRDLRGLRVFSAWVNHNDTKALNSLDMLVTEGGRQFIKHHLIDFSAVFGAEAFEPKSPRSGFVPLFDWTSSAKNFFTLGLYVPEYARANHPYAKEVGRLEADKFDPEHWVGNYYNPAFANQLYDDAFWAAKQVMTFTEPEVRAMVKTSEYTSAEGMEYLVKSLMQRREKIGRAYFSRVLPLDGFSVEGGRLRFEDLAVKYGFVQPRTFRYTWSTFNNETEARSPIAGAASDAIPAAFASGYAVVQIQGDDAKKTIDVYLRKRGGAASAPQVVGVERRW